MLKTFFLENMKDHPVCAILKQGGTYEWDLDNDGIFDEEGDGRHPLHDLPH